MARRRFRQSSERRKTEAEARIERITWALLVLVFAIVRLLPGANFPNFFVPLAGAIILLGSGVYQYSRHWRVSPVTWIGGTLLALFAFYDLQTQNAVDFTGAALLVFFAVIVFGLLTGDT